ncbi:MAG: BON domain-containing protein [Anaerolineae bacterium]|nr:BON domain-containing protein [Anaerolineae bacterium]
MHYHRQGLRHLILRALKRNTFTADQPIRITVSGVNVVLKGSVDHPDLIPEAVATVESVAPFLRVYSQLRVRGARVVMRS